MIQKAKKYLTFFKYVISSGISCVIDLILFTIFSKLLDFIIGDISIIVGTILARIISSFINYLINKNEVFKHDNKKSIEKNTLFKYYILVIVQMFVSAFAVWFISNFINIDATIIKMFVDIIIFMVNYIIQKKIIFKK